MRKIILALIFTLMSSVSFADGHSGKISLAGFFVGDAKAIVDEKGNVMTFPFSSTIALASPTKKPARLIFPLWPSANDTEDINVKINASIIFLIIFSFYFIVTTVVPGKVYPTT